MMGYELKPGRGSFWHNKDKTNHKAPDFKGVWKDHNGTMHRMSAWNSTYKEGTFSFSIDEEELKQGAPNPEPARRAALRTDDPYNGLPSRPRQMRDERFQPVQMSPDDFQDDDVPF